MALNGAQKRILESIVDGMGKAEKMIKASIAEVGRSGNRIFLDQSLGKAIGELILWETWIATLKDRDRTPVVKGIHGSVCSCLSACYKLSGDSVRSREYAHKALSLPISEEERTAIRESIGV